jgi:hypothetical protein
MAEVGGALPDRRDLLGRKALLGLRELMVQQVCKAFKAFKAQPEPREQRVLKVPWAFKAFRALPEPTVHRASKAR